MGFNISSLKLSSLLQNSISQKHHALLYVFIGAVLVSFSGVFVKLVHVGPTVSAFYRMFFGGVILSAVALFKRQPFWKGRKPFGLAAACGLFFAMDLFFWHRCVLILGPGLATLLGNFQVFFLTLAGILWMKERFGWRLMLAIPLAVLGIYLIVGIDWAHANASFKSGVWLGLATAVSYATYILILQYSQRQSRKLPLISNMAVLSLAAALILAAAVVLHGQESFVIPDVQSWSYLVLLGITGQVLGWVLISKGLPDLDASLAGLILLVQPALAFVWDNLFFDRSMSLIEITGAALTLGAIYLGSVNGKNK